MRALQQLKTDLQNIADPEKAKDLARFFKTGKGQYGEGDIFLGIMVPAQRRIGKNYASLSLRDIKSPCPLESTAQCDKIEAEAEARREQ
jgi:hypothetical protein